MSCYHGRHGEGEGREKGQPTDLPCFAGLLVNRCNFLPELLAANIVLFSEIAGAVMIVWCGVHGWLELFALALALPISLFVFALRAACLIRSSDTC